MELWVVDRQKLTTTWPLVLNPADTASQSRIQVRPGSVQPVPEEKRVSLPVLPTSLILLAALADPDFQLLHPIVLEVERGEGGEFIVSNRQLHNYGAGGSLQEAIDDYQSMLVDLYRELTDSEVILSRHLRERLDYLRTLLAPR
jgi:hypothetical protein